jgi:prepilin-type processing-associated H-X9-DG protein
VIAIIAILAAMLFPVFARARESARKIQCLSNVKNIAMAFQIYLTDFDRFPPFEHSTAVDAYLTNKCGSASCGSRLQCRGTSWNPYLRLPVILDEYVKNRDVWRCPSAIYAANTICVNWTEPDWLTYAAKSENSGSCPRMKLCNNIYPPGWGGSVTDTTLQAQCGLGNGAFDQSIGTAWHNGDVKMSSIDDVTKRVVCGDAGVDLNPQRTSGFAYPDYSRFDHLITQCGSDSGNCSNQSSCGNATVAAACSPLSMCFGGDGKFATDVTVRKQHTRHMGGSNLGFADGHAAWMDSETILFNGWNESGWANVPSLLDGLEMCFIPSPAGKK